MYEATVKVAEELEVQNEALVADLNDVSQKLALAKQDKRNTILITASVSSICSVLLTLFLVR